MKRSAEPIPDRVRKGSVPVLERLRVLDRTQLHAVLATLLDAQPYTSMVAYALSPDKKGIIFTTPRKTQKYKNILENNRVSLLIDTRSDTGSDYLNTEALTIIGEATPLRKGARWSALAATFLEKHPGLYEVVHSRETKLILVRITRCIHVTRFQTVSEWIL